MQNQVDQKLSGQLADGCEEKQCWVHFGVIESAGSDGMEVETDGLMGECKSDKSYGFYC